MEAEDFGFARVPPILSLFLFRLLPVYPTPYYQGTISAANHPAPRTPPRLGRLTFQPLRRNQIRVFDRQRFGLASCLEIGDGIEMCIIPATA